MDEVRKGIDEALEGTGREPLFGRGKKSAALFPPETEYRYFKGDLDCPDAKTELERLMTRSMRCQASLDKPGDVCVIAESGAFDKEGRYNVVVKYLCLPDAPPKPEKQRVAKDAPVASAPAAKKARTAKKSKASPKAAGKPISQRGRKTDV